MIETGFGAPDSLLEWTPLQLERLTGPVEAMRRGWARLPKVAPEDVAEVPDVELADADWKGLLRTLPRWTRLTAEGVMRQTSSEFTLRALYQTCLPAAHRQFPRNRNPRAKLRKQLQQLRDLGLIEFLGNGRYRRKIKVLAAS